MFFSKGDLKEHASMSVGHGVERQEGSGVASPIHGRFSSPRRTRSIMSSLASYTDAPVTSTAAACIVAAHLF